MRALVAITAAAPIHRRSVLSTVTVAKALNHVSVSNGRR